MGTEVKRKEDEKTKAMHEKSDQELPATQKNPDDIEAKLKDNLSKAVEELDKKRKANTDTETLCKKKEQNAENRLETNIKEYDQEMERLTEAVNKEKEIYNQEKAKLDEMEENYRKIKHAQEVNKKLEDEWALKRQQFEIEEN